MTINGQRTLYYILSELKRANRQEYIPLLNTTLNELFNIHPEGTIPASDHPTILAYSIGNGGNLIINNANGYVYSEHSPEHAALFNHIPFVMRVNGDDIVPEERKRYRMRVIEKIDGIEYICYYFRLIDVTEIRDYFYKISTVNGETVLKPYNTNTDKLLHPEPKLRTIDKEDITVSNYLCAVSKHQFLLTLKEMEELQKVYTLRKEDVFKISEIALIMGYDMEQKDGSFELARAQVSHFVHVDLDLGIQITKGVEILKAIELGGAEPIVESVV